MKKESYHHKNLRNSLIEKGIELVSADGVSQFSLRKVATACGVSHGAPYSHFKNKEELLEAMQLYVTQQFSSKLEKTMIEHKNEANILEYMGKAYVIFFIENPYYFSFLFSKSNIKIDLSLKEVTKENYKPFEIYKNLLTTLLNQSQFPKEKQKDAIIATWAFIHGITALATMENVYYDEDWSEKIGDFMSIFNCYFDNKI